MKKTPRARLNQCLVLFITTVALLSILTSTASAQFTEGYSHGAVTRGYSTSGTSLLRGFFFEFQSKDHHIYHIEMMPDKPSDDEITIDFRDHNGDDEYAYKIRHYPFTGAIYKGFAEQFGCAEECLIELDTPSNLEDYVFVISGFEFFFLGGEDHHIEGIYIYEEDGVATMGFHDDGNLNPFHARLSYAYVPKYRFKVIDYRSDTQWAGGGASIESGTALIRGFSLRFLNSDHHLKTFRVWAQDGTIAVDFADKNPSNYPWTPTVGYDRFDWTVEYGVLGWKPSIVKPISTVFKR